MSSPFRILKLLRGVRRPSRINDMRAVADAFWLRRGYDAMTFFGHIVTATNEEADRMNGRLTTLKNHETIHLYQARSTGDSWLRFYLLYFYYCLRALPQLRHMKHAPYLLNPFEMEAYRHDHDLDYLTRRSEATEWCRFARMTARERREQYQKLMQSAVT